MDSVERIKFLYSPTSGEVRNMKTRHIERKSKREERNEIQENGEEKEPIPTEQTMAAFAPTNFYTDKGTLPQLFFCIEILRNTFTTRLLWKCITTASLVVKRH
jgi:hypothetical protein